MEASQDARTVCLTAKTQPAVIGRRPPSAPNKSTAFHPPPTHPAGEGALICGRQTSVVGGVGDRDSSPCTNSPFTSPPLHFAAALSRSQLNQCEPRNCLSSIGAVAA